MKCSRNFEQESELREFINKQVEKINKGAGPFLYDLDSHYGERITIHRILTDHELSEKTFSSFQNSEIISDRDVILRICLAFHVDKASLPWVFQISSGHIYPFVSREKVIVELYDSCAFSIENLNEELLKRGLKPVSLPSENKRGRSR